MTITPTQFRVNFPAFAETVAYSDAAVTMWLTEAYNSMNPLRWGASLDIGAQLFAAHMLVLDKQGNDTAAEGSGGDPGIDSGILSGASVGSVSANYDTSTGVLPEDGHWARTTYGRRLIWMANLRGLGGMYIAPCGGPGSGLPWPGPITPFG